MPLNTALKSPTGPIGYLITDAWEKGIIDFPRSATQATQTPCTTSSPSSLSPRISTSEFTNYLTSAKLKKDSLCNTESTTESYSPHLLNNLSPRSNKSKHFMTSYTSISHASETKQKSPILMATSFNSQDIPEIPDKNEEKCNSCKVGLGEEMNKMDVSEFNCCRNNHVEEKVTLEKPALLRPSSPASLSSVELLSGISVNFTRDKTEKNKAVQTISNDFTMMSCTELLLCCSP